MFRVLFFHFLSSPFFGHVLICILFFFLFLFYPITLGGRRGTTDEYVFMFDLIALLVLFFIIIIISILSFLCRYLSSIARIKKVAL